MGALVRGPVFGRAAVAAVLTMALLALAPVASADSVVGSPGAGAGQYNAAQAVAVDNSNGHLYVADRANNRVDVFDSTGNFVEAVGWGVADGSSTVFQRCIAPTCFAGLAGEGSGQFKAPSRIAVDNNPASPAFRSVYVYDGGNLRVQRLTPTGSGESLVPILVFGKGVNQTTAGDICTVASGNVCRKGSEGFGEGQFEGSVDPIAVGGVAGTIYAGGEGRVQKFAPTGAFGGQVKPLMRDECEEGKASKEVPLVKRTVALAADAAGNFYVATPGETGGVRKYDSSGKLLDPCKPRDYPSFNILAVGIDAAGNLFVSDSTGIAHHVNKYDPAGTLVSVIYGSVEHRVTSLAIYPAPTGDVFAIDTPFSSGEPKVVQIPFPPSGPIVLPFKGTFASPVSNTKATLHATINPEGKASTFHFEYVDDATFKVSGFATAKETAENPSIGADFNLYEVSQQAGCPVPTEALIAEGKCLTPETTYHFRAVATNAGGVNKGPEATFKTTRAVEPGPTWATEVGLESARLHAEVNPLGIPAEGYFEYVEDAIYQVSGFAEAVRTPAGAGTIDFGSGEAYVAASVQAGPLKRATTYHFRVVAENAFAVVPGEQRAFTTLAKPADSDACPNKALRLDATFLPDCRAYEMVSPPDKDNGDIITLGTTVGDRAELPMSAAAGGKVTYSSFRSFANAESSPYSSQYMAGRDPAAGWSTRAITPPQVGTSKAGPLAGLDTTFKAFSEDLCGAWVNYGTDLALDPNVPGGFMNLYQRENCGAEGYEALVEEEPAESGGFTVELQGLSDGGSCAVFRASSPLVASPPAPNKADTFQVYENCGAGLRLISVLPNGTASEIDSSAGTPGNSIDGRRAAVANAISADGSRVFWSQSFNGPGKLFLRLNAGQPQSAVSSGECTEPTKACTLAVSAGGARFWAAAADGSRAVYEEGGSLHLFELEGDKGKDSVIAAETLGVLGTSEDATRIYFASKKALDGAAKAGQPNLYLHEGATNRYIATLAASDIPELSPVEFTPTRRVARVSADGAHAAFMSQGSLTGYDNLDANSGKADAEVYLYDAVANASAGKLICASCNPSGARPVGRDVKSEVNVFTPYWAAAQIPSYINQLYATRVLSDDGNRLFFESTDGLVTHDTNGVQDVYQWEAEGFGNCKATGTGFVASSGGCVNLISSGESPQDSSFLDASTDGADVFFTTSADLLARDHGLIDIYDARVEGGFPEGPPPIPPCEGEACQNPAAPPNDPIPSSSLYHGPGNIASPKPKPKCPKGKHRVNRNGKSTCVKKPHKGKQNRDRRAQR